MESTDETRPDREALIANRVIADAVAYRAERLTMNNPKGWDHVQRVVEYAIDSGMYSTEHVAEARPILAALAALPAPHPQGGTEAPFPMFGFEGCTDRNPDICACATHEEVECEACGEVIEAGVLTYARQESLPWMDADDANQEWTTVWWHAACDSRSRALLAAAPAPTEGQS